MKKPVTIKFIAENVGVSTTTISRYINGKYEYMSKDTKEKIRETIELYDYSANNMARGLKVKKSNMIGIIVSTLNYQVASHQVSGMHDVFSKNGFSTIIYSSDNNEERELEAIKMCLNQQVDGIVLMPNSMNCDYYNKVYENGTPMVLYNRFRYDWKYSGVYVDNAALTKNALQHMFDCGYTKIAFFTDNKYKTSNKTFREEAYIDFAKKYMGLDGRNLIYLIENSDQMKTSINTFKNMYPNERKGLFAINSGTLFLALQNINEQGMKIPEDIGVCGYDATGWSELVKPGITSLDQPSYIMGTQVAELLMETMKNKESIEPRHIWLEGSMIIRDSTRKV